MSVVAVKIRYFASILMLCLMLIRVTPFNILHYHNQQFADVEGLSPVLLTDVETNLDVHVVNCALHQYFSLLQHSFIYSAEFELNTTSPKQVFIPAHNSGIPAQIYIDINNKGSPAGA